ncbi:hypothetical protein M0813_01783 [Anaeramoeba flamelloides]|uniref:Uncharacterized protein n=1 Tax=Anaeramoeba flamelloides TaxID=1746091 RepID=A0ABQ8YWZ8_9EUKA|nr:hypothetical protein M0813_01783 [Anaeramoeba flamelloides]
MNKNKLVQQQQQQQQKNKPLNQRKRNFHKGNESQKVTRNMGGQFVFLERKETKGIKKESYGELPREQGRFLIDDLIKHRQSKNLELMVNKISEMNQRNQRGLSNDTIPTVQLQIQRPTKEICEKKGKQKLNKMNNLLLIIAKTYK